MATSHTSTDPPAPSVPQISSRPSGLNAECWMRPNSNRLPKLNTSVPSAAFTTFMTPDDAAARIAEFQAQSGGFGTFLILAQNAAPWAATQRSYEMFARYVAPRFQHSDRRADSLDFAEANSDQFIGAMVQGIGETLEKHGRFLKPA